MTPAFFKAYQNLAAKGDLLADKPQEAAVQALDNLSRGLKENRRWLLFFSARKKAQNKSLYLWGGVGRGKTMLMDLFFQHLKIQQKRRLHFIEFMKETHARLKVLRQHTEGDVLVPLAKEMADQTTLLCLDEFQVNDIADASILGRLFSALLEEGVIIVATSNRPPDELYFGGLNRERFLPFIDLLKQRTTQIALGHGKDFRRDGLSGKERYYIHQEKDFLENFQNLTKGQGKASRLEMFGRTLSVPQQALGCALFHFNDLCAQPLGANDYLYLAHTYHTIFVNKIPHLSAAKRNETKRFIHFIDVLYDNKIILIANANAAPDDLYQKEQQLQQSTESFEFERTASRLNEMMSPDYLNERSKREQ